MPLSRLLACCGILALGIALVLATGCKKTAKKDPPPDSKPQPAVPNAGGGGEGKGASGVIPAGWEEARDTVAGFRILMPGKTADSCRLLGRKPPGETVAAKFDVALREGS